jgi:hypothetical protein
VDDAPEITVLQLPKFKTEATELIGADGIETVCGISNRIIRMLEISSPVPAECGR